MEFSSTWSCEVFKVEFDSESGNYRVWEVHGNVSFQLADFSDSHLAYEYAELLTQKVENMDNPKRHQDLCWKLTVAKVLYYRPELFSQDTINRFGISDEEFDLLDREYLQLCLDLKIPNTLSHNTYPGLESVPGEGMFEIDLRRPDVCMVIAWLHLQEER